MKVDAVTARGSGEDREVDVLVSDCQLGKRVDHERHMGWDARIKLPGDEGVGNQSGLCLGVKCFHESDRMMMLNAQCVNAQDIKSQEKVEGTVLLNPRNNGLST